MRLVVSWVLVAIGVPMLVRSELGAAPFDVLNTGVSEATGWSFGTAFVVDAMVFYAIGRLLGARLGWGCVAGTLAIGPMIDVVLAVLPEDGRLLVRIALLLAGIAILGLGICLVVTTELGPGPTEVLMLGLVRRGLGIVPARWIADGVPVVVGALLGGALGIGTAVFALAMGPIVKWGLRRLNYEPERRRLEAAATGF